MNNRLADRRMIGVISILGLVALLLREHYILTARVENPMVGDVRQYVAYAYNMVEHHVFSSSLPGSATVVPDSYRGPGYPLLIAALMAITGASSPNWYFLVLHAQALLGAATVVLTVLIGWRHRPATGLIAGTLVMLWPMHITFTGVLLSEVWFGFLLALAIWLSLKAGLGPRWITVAAGSTWALANFVNPIAFFLPFACAWWLARSDHRRKAWLLLGVFLAIQLPWMLRDSMTHGPHVPPRSVVNFVQGSWPLYHDVWVEFRRDPYAKQVMKEIDDEIKLTDARPVEGARTILRRLASDPASYARWYLLQKPYLLWDWDIRIGSGGLFAVDTVDSPYQREKSWSGAAAMLRAGNPWLFFLAVAGAILAFARRRPDSEPLFVLALVFAYVTLVHVVFQAEPRYSVAYRFVEFLLAASVVAALIPRRGQDADLTQIAPK